ncbi:MAG: hypothetical protein ACU0BF_05830 [Paracoccaceae bacterium]
MTDHDAWLKRTLADAIGEDRGLPDYAIQRLRGLRPDDLAELRINERERMLDAFRHAVHQSRDARAASTAEDGQSRPPLVDGDIDWGLRAAKSALEAEPAGQRSDKATELLAACTCPAATGPNPGIDGGGRAHAEVMPALEREPGSPERPLPY